ncbi:MAG: DNA repair protein RadC [Lentisphaerae bacterium]|nr:DNA repair protein RadC [Lentisphaerota bacterium]
MYDIKSHNLKVQDIPQQERPRELLDRFGAENVQTDVLLAILLRSGVKGMSVIQIARNLINDYGNLTAIAKEDMFALAKRKGVGKVKAQVLKSAFELARRMGMEQSPQLPTIHSPADVADLLRPDIRMLDKEIFWAIYLDNKHRVKRKPNRITEGILNASLVHPREVFRPAITLLSAAVILAHNHPSGDPTPSQEDIKVTRNMIEAGKLIGIPVVDHVIIGKQSSGLKNDFYSLREENTVSFS